MEPIRLGIIGYGFSAKCFHLPFINVCPDFKVVAFFQRTEAPKDPTSAKPGSHCTVDYPNTKHYQNADDFFADKDIDVVIVCSKQDTHAEYAEKALKAGKHVVVEKPFTRTTEEADRLISLAKTSGKILTVFQNRRWDNDFLTLRHLLDKDAFGTIKECEIHYDVDFPFWMRGMNKKEYSPGDGMTFGLGTVSSSLSPILLLFYHTEVPFHSPSFLLNVAQRPGLEIAVSYNYHSNADPRPRDVLAGSHTFDQALLLFGRPKSVTGFLRVLRGADSEIEDSFTAILQYDGPQQELLVTVKTMVVSTMKDQLKYFIRGTKGSFVKHGTCIQEEQILSTPSMAATDPDFGREPPHLYGLLTTKGEHAFDHAHQVYEPDFKLFVGRYPTIPGHWLGFYENLRDAVRGKADIAVKPEQSRDGIRLIELVRLSSQKGQAVEWH